MNDRVEGRGRRVLVVDDDVIQLKLTALGLVTAGFVVETVTCGSAALAAARRQPPDIVLSDVLMDEIDGFTLCRMLRDDSDVPVVLAGSHFHESVDAKLAHAAGASALVRRSPEFGEVLEALGAALAHPAPGLNGPAAAFAPEAILRRVTRKLTEFLAQSSAAEARYRTLFDHANDGIALVDAKGVIRKVNPRMTELFGRAGNQLEGHHVSEFAIHGQEQQITDHYQASLAAGRNQVPVPVQRGDGKQIFVEFSNTSLEVDGQTMMLSLGRDVTESFEAQRKLEASEEKYRSLLESLPDVIWSADRDGNISFMSPNAEAMFGFAADEMRTSAFRASRAHPDQRDKLAAAHRALIKQGVPFDLEYRFQRKDGAWIWIHNRMSTRADVARIDGVCSDITARKRLEEQALQSQKMEAVGQLTAGVAHDFNNILGVILANTHFLSEDLGPQDPRRADVEEIQTAAQRAAALTRQLLAFSRRQVLQLGVLDLGGVVAGVEKMLRRVIGEDIEFSVATSEGLGSVLADPGQLEQVIMNLVINARDAMPRGGQIAISTANLTLAPAAAVELSVPPGEYVTLSISDTGCGMDAATQQHIFEPFFTTKAAGRGTGLGLSTCYGIVQQSQGAIAVQSALGQGTIFTVYLPRLHGRSRETATGRVQPLGKLAGHETILLVEDETPIRNAAIRILEGHGYRVLAARDGFEAERLARQHCGKIQLVLSDVVMPGASGPEVVRRVQSLSAGARALFMSGYTDHPLLRDAELGAGPGFLAKPFLPEALALKVREVLDA